MIYEIITILMITIQAAQFVEVDSLTSENNERRIVQTNMMFKSTVFQIDEKNCAMNDYKASIIHTENPEPNLPIGEENFYIDVDQPLTKSLINSSYMNKFPYIDEDAVSDYDNLEKPEDDFKQHAPSSKVIIRLDLDTSSDDFYDVTDILESIAYETAQENSNSEQESTDHKPIKENVSSVVEDVTQDEENLITNSQMDPEVLDELYVSFLILDDSKDVEAGPNSEQMPDIINFANSPKRSSILKVSKKKSEQESPAAAIFGYHPVEDKEFKCSKCVKFEDSKVQEPKKKKSSSSCFGCFFRSRRNYLDSENFDRFKKNYVY
ncbi:hypothetical protein NBO_66g0025 [Nosema bombycis CQ1]|uniref:Uncharacterized protein n=1 Tax=Nosema bombycis (strain CQ1 / CVCC 102059) TaxID=578461 RepID=R0KS24_NOSB1|nr:hypothetical protein NBO_66g0025 [Nosema bombycis CQ1]|eukprot:EOB13566.1 hypothetical protein NBO_66g0025 [Nosema bombycis CQ1]